MVLRAEKLAENWSGRDESVNRTPLLPTRIPTESHTTRFSKRHDKRKHTSRIKTATKTAFYLCVGPAAPSAEPSPQTKSPAAQLREGAFECWSTRPGSNRRPPRWQRVPTPGFCCVFPRNRRREPHWARPRSSDATRALRAPPGDPESGGGSPTHARASTSRSSVCRVIARALRNRRLAGFAPERGGSRKVIDFH